MAVSISGDGNIGGITSFNGGGLAFRNILYNGWVNTNNEINQRSKTISQVSNGDYWADRWQRVSSTTMTQKIEESNYVPGRTYTLSGTNVTTVQITSPASGTWNWGTVPSNASLVQLELGDSASSFEYRPYGLELSLCQRYYETGTVLGLSGILHNNGDTRGSIISFKNTKRIAPSMVGGPIQIFTVGPTGSNVNLTCSIITYATSPLGFVPSILDNVTNLFNATGGSGSCIAWSLRNSINWAADSEL